MAGARPARPDSGASRLAIRVLGRSVEGRPIEAYVSRARGLPTALVLGGVHGDEPKGVYVARQFLGLLENGPPVPAHYRWVIVPVVNPDGYARRTRRNARRVDLNRNLPTRDWEPGSRRSRMYGGERAASEPETRALISAVTEFSPERIISIHSISNRRQCNNYDGPGRRLAQRFAASNGYPVTPTIGYATPGSLGTWAGQERRIATLTLELPSRDSRERCWKDNCAGFVHL